MRQGRSIPKEVARDVGPRSRVGQPVHAIGMQGEMQPVGVPVSTPERAALEAGITIAGAQHRETLRLEEETPGRPGRGIGWKLGSYVIRRPPRQRVTGHGKRDTWQRCAMKVRLEQLRSRRRRLVQSGEPALELTFPVSRFPFPETRAP